jgi:hypothetical protein
MLEQKWQNSLFATQNRKMIGFTRPIRALCAVSPLPPYRVLLGMLLLWKGGALGKQNNGITTAITSKSIGGQTDKSGLGSQQQFDSRTSVIRRNNLQEYESKRDKDRQSRKRESKQPKPEVMKDVNFVCRLTAKVEKRLSNKRKR